MKFNVREGALMALVLAFLLGVVFLLIFLLYYALVSFSPSPSQFFVGLLVFSVVLAFVLGGWKS